MLCAPRNVWRRLLSQPPHKLHRPLRRILSLRRSRHRLSLRAQLSIPTPERSAQFGAPSSAPQSAPLVPQCHPLTPAPRPGNPARSALFVRRPPRHNLRRLYRRRQCSSQWRVLCLRRGRRRLSRSAPRSVPRGQNVQCRTSSCPVCLRLNRWITCPLLLVGDLFQFNPFHMISFIIIHLSKTVLSIIIAHFSSDRPF